VSAGAIPYAKRHSNPWADASTLDLVGESLRQIGHAPNLLADYMSPGPGWFALFLWPLVVAGAFAASALMHSEAAPSRRSLAILAVAATAVSIQLIIHAAVRWHVREWYALAFFPLLALFVGMVVDAARVFASGRWRMMPLLILVPLFMLGKAITLGLNGFYPAQLDMLEGARWVNAETPPYARVGGFNSGILSYYSGRTTVNLDGVMNPDAIQAMRNRRLVAYMVERDLDYVVDFTYWPGVFFRDFIESPWNFSAVETFNEHKDFQGPYTVWETGTRNNGH
jgi:hypothetical protein